MKMKRIIFFISIVFLFLSCDNEVYQPEQNQTNSSFIQVEVKFKGALKNMMQNGDISSKVSLNDFANIKNFYAIGACENLKGEIQIIDSKPFNSFVQNGKVELDQTFKKNATLLVYAQVPEWIETTIPEDVVTYQDFEKFLAQKAKEFGYNVEKPIPFQIKGNAQKVDWHVIDWEDGDTEHSHEKHINSGINGSFENEYVLLLGFFSKHHQTIFTHHSNFTHIHVLNIEKQIAGHVDDMLLGDQMVLLLPLLNTQ